MDGAPLAIFVGTDTEQALAFQVLAHSIRRWAKAPVKITSLGEALASAGLVIPEPESRKNQKHTPFSFQRFAIPELNGFRGMAVYMDSDMLVFRDVHELLDLTPPEVDVASVLERPDSGRASQISVMVLNCARLGWSVRKVIEDLDRGTYTYGQLFNELPIARRFARALPSFWNDLERYIPGQTALTHFTDMELQPWLYARHKLGRLWCEALFDALEAGATTAPFVFDHVRKGWVRPSLAYQIERDIVDPSELPERMIHWDAFTFTPPHRVGIIPHKWAYRLASNLTAYGESSPSRGARLMRSFQAVGYQAYKRLRGRRLILYRHR